MKFRNALSTNINCQPVAKVGSISVQILDDNDEVLFTITECLEGLQVSAEGQLNIAPMATNVVTISKQIK